MLEEKLKKIDKYFISLNKNGDYKGLEVVFPDNWEIKKFESLDGGKIIESHRRDDGKVVFIGNENISLIELVEFVDLTVITNKENEAKEVLLNDKIKELKEKFKTKSLAELESLKFIFALEMIGDLPTEVFIDKKDVNSTDERGVKDIKKMIKTSKQKDTLKGGNNKDKESK